MRAAADGDAQSVAAWLDEGGCLDARCAEHNSATLLMAAAAGGQAPIVRMLLQRGASVNLQSSNGSTALMQAAVNGHTTTAQALLDAEADALLQATKGRTALIFAEQEKHTETAQLLREHAKQQAAEAEGLYQLLKPGRQARAAASVAHAAAAADAMASELLGEEAAVKEAAAAKKSKGKKKKAKAVISTSASEPAAAASAASAPEALAAEAGLPEAVWTAAMNGDAQVVTAWLEEGGGIHAGCAEFEGMTLLMAAATGGHKAMVQMLLQGGARVNLQNSIGWTALMMAAGRGRTTTVQVLLDAKTDASLQTIDGETALVWAERAGTLLGCRFQGTVKLLRQHAERQTSEAEARAATAAVELLEEVEAEKEAAAKKGKSKKKKKAKAAPSTILIEPDQRVQSAATADDAVGAVAHLLGQASLQVPAGSSEADAGAAAPVAAMASAALERPPSLPVTVMSLATAHFDTGRPDVPESTIGGQTTCIVCFSSPKSHVAVPCGHQCACSKCSAQMKECPVCRTPVATWVHVRVA